MTTVNWNQMQADIKREVERVGYNYIADRPLSNHPDDWYLRVVWAFNEREHVVWTYNQHSKGLFEGHYTTHDHAQEDYINRS